MNRILLFLILITLQFIVKGQQNLAKPDSVCVQQGAMLMFNPLINDLLPSPLPPGIQVQLVTTSPCFVIQENKLTWKQGAQNCCGEHNLVYQIVRFTPTGAIQVLGQSVINVTVKCPKPNCTLVNLDDIQSSPTAGADPRIYVCEDTPVTFYASYANTNTYAWAIGPSGNISAGANPAEVVALWASPGVNSLTLTINGTPTIYIVNVLPAPIASFTSAMNCVCLNSPISFTNTSIGASSYFWEFGDGNNSTAINPTHNYASPGTYTVTLIAFSSNYAPNGDPLCCCSDTFQMDIIVDEKPGPNIYCISTLCEGDTSKYWTDATGCSYVWSVFDANNNPITFTGQGNDTICVVWGSGPYGSVTLDLNACSPAIWCEKPVTVQVPIISSIEQIDGDINVCAFSKEVYSLPKWNGTIYDWSVTGGMIVSGDSMHEVVIMWGPGPVGTIHVDYWNPFLQGLPGHENEDCRGVADLTVNIRPQWNLSPTNPIYCVGDPIPMSTSSPGLPLGFTYTISPPLTGWPIISTTPIAPVINVPNTYTICVYPNNPNLFCNDTICRIIKVKKLDAPDSIVCPSIVCPGVPYQYTAYSNETGVKYVWTVTGGTPASFTGNPINVTWNNSGPISLSVAQMDINNPQCMSTIISYPVTRRMLNGPLSLVAGNYCINSIQNFSINPIQDPSATFSWSIIPSVNGSIYQGNGSSNVQIQWNNIAGLTTIKCVVKLCKDSLVFTQNVTLKAPVQPNIAQIGALCTGVNATLTPGVGPFVSAAWSGGTPSGLNTIVSGPSALYVVTTTDMMGCTAKDSYTTNTIPDPIASISTGNPEFICIPFTGPPPTVLYTALNGGGYTYNWTCNGNPSGTGQTLTHTASNTPGSFTYQVKVTDTNGCMATSLPRTVVQGTCTGPGSGGCTPISHSIAINAMQMLPNCNKWSFSVTASPGTVTPVSWSFGTVYGTIGGSYPTSPTFTYDNAGVYLVVLSYQVPSTSGGFCLLTTTTTVQVDIGPRFFSTITGNCREVKFTNSSTLLPGVSITSYNWQFGPGGLYGSSALPMPTVTFPFAGTFPVTMTVTTNTGCVVSITNNITINGVSTAGYSIMASPACVGDQVMFNYLGNQNDILTYSYNFGDGSTNGGPSPKHAYLMPGSPIVTSLTVTDIYNCTAITSQSIIINPLPPKDTIAYSPDLKLCAGQSLVLTAPFQLGGSYLWNTLAATQSITVTSAGVYKVTVYNSYNCPRALDSVEVKVCPLPDAIISGPNYICDNGCIDLEASIGYQFMYQWHGENGLPLLGQTNAALTICDFALQDSVYVVITDANGCTNKSAWHKISIAMSPNVAINVVTGSPICAGNPNMFTAVSSSTNVRFLWSTGATSATIIAVLPGSYTVMAIDTLTGCSNSATVTVNPLPDFCELPFGCYESCNPDTLCGPPGMIAYQWNKDGLPLTGEIMQCLEVTMDGTYTLMATNSYGCTATSDSVMLDVFMCCDTADTKIIATPINPFDDDCCYSLSYINALDSLMELYISTSDADLMIVPGSLNPSLALVSNTSSSLTLQNTTAGVPLPSGTLSNFVKICAKDIINTPVVVYFTWYGPEGQNLCRDSLVLECNPSSCVFIEDDMLLCDPTTPSIYNYSITVCNSSTNTFDIRYIDIIELTPPGVIVSPSNVSILPLAPGNCTTINFVISGSSIINKNFCFNLVAHEYNPNLNPEAKCCSLDTIHCIFIPGCDPCDSTYVKNVLPTVQKDDCCYDVTLSNYHSASTYVGIGVCALTTGATVTLSNPGVTWSTDDLQPTSFTIGYLAGFIPSGDIPLPRFCVNNPSITQNQIEIKWLSYGLDGYITICTDTITVDCENDCGYFSEIKTKCKNKQGDFEVHAVFHNTSSDTVYSAAITFHPSNPSYNTSINFLGGVAPGNSFGPILISLGAPYQPGDTVCMITSMHNNPKQDHICCQFKTNVIVPQCEGVLICECDERFEKEVYKGINCIINGNTVTFSPLGKLTDCDRIIWDFTYNGTSQFTIGNQSITHTFPGPKEYELCVTFIRTTPEGKTCKFKLVKVVKIKKAISFRLSPNPASTILNLQIDTNDDETLMQHATIFDNHGQMIMHKSTFTDDKGLIKLDIAHLVPGIYMIRLDNDVDMVYKKFIKIE